MTATHGPAIEWDRLRNRPLSREEKQLVRAFYSGGYHDKWEYTTRHPWHRLIADYRAELTRTVFQDTGKVLDGGCAGGEELVALRKLGIEAWGFDMAPDLHEFVYTDAAPFVRIGPMNAIPYSPADGFKTFVSYDVFEHVPVDALERLPDELVRLGITQVACIVSADTESPGHITIQDTAWYEQLFARKGFRMLHEITEILNEILAPAGWDHQRQVPLIVPYTQSGRPRNGWNSVPGHCFFRRDR
jgi:SAM-dependent methyltransferase